MGERNSKKSGNNDKSSEIVSKASFEYVGVIGKGGFGKVWKVILKKYNIQYAMKEMSKAKVIDKKSENSIKNERELLSHMNHPFIINMHYAFQDNDYIYLVMDLLTGGDLRYHLLNYKKFTEEQTRFFMACIILGLEYCHTNNILHRDIKPENLVLDEKGYVKVTDFGVAKVYHKENFRETSGTPGYMAPEVMSGQNHTIAVDYFALGVIGYEFMTGERPYIGKSRKEIKEKVMARQVQVKKGAIPRGWSTEAVDCINRLLQRKPVNRLGLRGPAEVKEHAWFKYFPWKDLYLGKLESPFIPRSGDNFDFYFCITPDTITIHTQARYSAIIKNDEYKDIFKDYYYFNRETQKNGEQTSKYTNPHLVYIQASYDSTPRCRQDPMKRNPGIFQWELSWENETYSNNPMTSGSFVAAPLQISSQLQALNLSTGINSNTNLVDNYSTTNMGIAHGSSIGYSTVNTEIKPNVYYK